MLKRNLPNAVTLLNLALGCVGIQQLLIGNAELAPLFIILAAVCDFFDGMLARLLNAQSPIGKDLDSLADSVSFGVLPGLIAFELMDRALAGHSNILPDSLLYTWLPMTFVLLPVLSVVRLARFNHDTRQTVSFIGLPTPANGMFWCGLAWGINTGIYGLLLNPYLLAALVVLFSFLLVSPLKMFSFKFKSKGLKGNMLQYIYLLLAAPVLYVSGIPGMALLVLLYIVFSLPGNFSKDTAE